MGMGVAEAYGNLGLEVGCSRNKVEKIYNQQRTKYLAGKLSFNKWYIIDLSYTEIISHLDGLDEYNAQEKIRQKRMLLVETEKARRLAEAIKEEEEHKGPLWVLLEKMDIDNIKDNNIDFWQYLEENVLSLLPQEYAQTYKEFLDMFKNLWEELYTDICRYEYHLLVSDSLTSSCSFSIGEDELTKEHFKLGHFGKMFEYSEAISSLIPDSEYDYLVKAHFALVAKYAGFEFSSVQFLCPIYSFEPNTRLKKFRQEYLDQFDKERKEGKRQGIYVDNDELRSYVIKALRPYNSNLKPEEKE